jgi:hypothetical protein
VLHPICRTILQDNLKKHLPFNLEALVGTTGKIYIHQLESGYNLDEKLQANAQFGITL